jgi:hypothetical protein
LRFRISDLRCRIVQFQIFFVPEPWLGSSISHVADTALWVATYRALESERPDALFHDRMAGVLAGERGKNIAAGMPYPR